MLATAFRQMSFAWSMLTGRHFRAGDHAGLVNDIRLTLETFGSLGDGAGDAFAPADPELQRQLSTRRLRRTVRRAARETPYYRRWFEANGVDPARVSIDSLVAVAPTPKRALREAPAEFVSGRATAVLAATTTGTTGEPTVVWFSRYDLEVITALNAMALMLTGGVRPHHVWANCVGSRSLGHVLNQRSVPLTGAAFIQLGVADPRTTLDRLSTPLLIPGKEARVTHLNVSASYLALLVEQAEREGRGPRDFGLIEIHSSSEVLTDALAARAEETFGAPVIDVYSMTEIVPVAGQVCSRGHLHLPVGQGHVEVLDPERLEPTAPGALGVITVTPYAFYRETTMLLRYITGDLVRALPDARADCEMAGVPATSRIMGRAMGSALTTRDLLDLLQAERELPLPTRFAVEETAAGPVLHVVAARGGRALLARLEQRSADLALPLHGVVLVAGPEDLPAPCPLRSDLREHGYEARGHGTPAAARAGALR